MQARRGLSPGRTMSACPSPRARSSPGAIPAWTASSASLARTMRVENAPNAALDGVNLPAKAATMMMPARLALARSEVHSASA